MGVSATFKEKKVASKRKASDAGAKKSSSGGPSKAFSSIQGAADKSGGGTKQRYNAKVERGASAYKAEWSGFASGIKMSEQQGGGGMKLKKGEDLAFAEGSTFGYLFQSTAEKKVARQAKVSADSQEQERKRNIARNGDDRSKMQRAVDTAKTTGLIVPSADMNRKEKRKLLRLTVSTEAEKPTTEKRQLQAHELMDTKQAWYQQGPSPLDQLAEKLVLKKAEKQGKQRELKYNYLKPHASWILARARNRMNDLPYLGDRTTFPDSDAEEEDKESSSGSTSPEEEEVASAGSHNKEDGEDDDAVPTPAEGEVTNE